MRSCQSLTNKDMYVPKNFQKTDKDSILEFIRQNSFGILVTNTSGKMLATHIPLELSEDGQKLHGHISRANPQGKDFTHGEEVMAIFNGPHAYISSSWYNHENVPTWNYMAAHVYGTIAIIEAEKLLASLSQLVDKYESASEKPVSVEKMSREYLERQVRGIIGFEIHISRMEAAYKLSQNRDKVNHEAIIHQLEKRNQDHDLKIADAMRRNF